MSNRRPIGLSVQADVLMRSRRRCCLCAYLNGDLREKQGQIAHLDHDSSNADLDNLVFLCFDHHDRYDSSTRQSKGLLTTEVVRYRARLYQWSADFDNFESQSSSNIPSLTFDIPWAFEIHYSKFKLLFRISPQIYDILPNHKPTDIQIDQAIEDPTHTIKDCFQLLETRTYRWDWENEDEYISRKTLPKSCFRCKKLILDIPPYFREILHNAAKGRGEVELKMLSLKRCVFNDIRRLISIETPLAGRIVIKDWQHLKLSVTFTAGIPDID